MNNGWTGGQYTLFRFVFAGYLLIHFIQLLPWSAEVFSSAGALPDAEASPLIRLFPNILGIWDSPAFVRALIGFGALLCVPFAIGYRDRWAAVGIWYVWACLYGRNPLIANPSLPYVGWLLLAHACLPRAPWGSWDRRSETDPGSEWRMPAGIFAAVWIAMAAGYSYSGYTKLVSASWADGTAFYHLLHNPLARPSAVTHFAQSLPLPLVQIATWGALATELLFAPLALIPRIRPLLWTVMLAMHLSLIMIVDFADLSFGMVMLHFFTLDPAWLGWRRAGSPQTIFYDGHCGLCHGTVRWVLSEDRRSAFRFAPLDSDAFRQTVRTEMPESIVVQRADGAVLTRSAAVEHILDTLGGLWRVPAALLRFVPLNIRDRAYDFIAARRRMLFRAPDAACPLLPPELRARFLV